jgi:hypothetical protein
MVRCGCASSAWHSNRELSRVTPRVLAARVHSNIYGTSIKGVEDVRAAGKTCLLDIDVQGAELVKKTNLNAIFIFVAPPSYEELERRLRGARRRPAHVQRPTSLAPTVWPVRAWQGAARRQRRRSRRG